MGRALADSTPTEIGLRVKALREAADIESFALSHAVQYSKAVVYQLERGIIVVPSAELLFSLADALGTTGEYLLRGKGEPPSAVQVEASFMRHTQPGAFPTAERKDG